MKRDLKSLLTFCLAGIYTPVLRILVHFLSTLPSGKFGRLFLAPGITLCLLLCGWVLQAQPKPQANTDVKIELMPFNSTYSDFSPAFTRNGLLFTSNRPAEGMITYVNEADQQPLMDVYMVTRRDSADRKWTAPRAVKGDINTVVNDGPVTVSADGRLMFFTRNYKYEHKLGNIKSKDNYLALFSAIWSDDKWTNVQPFVHNSPEYASAHPSLSTDGQWLYFASNMPGGYGGTDIYACRRKEGGGWEKPVNLGPRINSESNEMYPFIHPNGTLFFASDGLNSMGGLDIFKAHHNGKDWEYPVNMGEPINSEFNDYGLIIDGAFRNGFFTSNRMGATNGLPSDDNIYAFTLTSPVFAACGPQEENNRCYTFFEEGTPDLEGMPMAYEWRLGDSVRIRGIEADYCFPREGSYLVQLNVIDSLTGDTFFTEATYTLSISDIEQAYMIAPDSVTAGEISFFDGRSTNLPGFQQLLFYWDFGNGYRYQLTDTLSFAYPTPGSYTLQMGVLAVNGVDTTQFCVSKTINVLPPGGRESRKNRRLLKTYQFRPSESFSVSPIYRQEDVPTYSKDLRQPGDYFSVQFLRSDRRLLSEAGAFDRLSHLSSRYGAIREYFDQEQGGYLYAIGQEKELKDTYPIYRSVYDSGYREAVVKVLSINDSVQIVFTPIQYEFFFEANEAKIAASDQGFNTFVRQVKEKMEQEGNVILLVEASASKVPLRDTSRTNLDLATERAGIARKLLIETLQTRGVNTDLISFEPDIVLVQGPEYKNDLETNREVYKKYQYVKVIRVIRTQ